RASPSRPWRRQRTVGCGLGRGRRFFTGRPAKRNATRSATAQRRFRLVPFAWTKTAVFGLERWDSIQVAWRASREDGQGFSAQTMGLTAVGCTHCLKMQRETFGLEVRGAYIAGMDGTFANIRRRDQEHPY